MYLTQLKYSKRLSGKSCKPITEKWFKVAYISNVLNRKIKREKGR